MIYTESMPRYHVSEKSYICRWQRHRKHQGFSGLVSCQSALLLSQLCLPKKITWTNTDIHQKYSNFQNLDVHFSNTFNQYIQHKKSKTITISRQVMSFTICGVILEDVLLRKRIQPETSPLSETADGNTFIQLLL